MRHPRPASAAPLPAASESAARLLRVKPRRTCRGPARVMDLPGYGRGAPLCDISVSLTRGGRHDLVGGASERTFSNPVLAASETTTFSVANDGWRSSRISTRWRYVTTGLD